MQVSSPGLASALFVALIAFSPLTGAQSVEYGCNADQLLMQEEPATSDHMGQSIAVGGDFNGDGFRDIVMGGYKRNPAAGMTRVFVFLGTGSSPSGSPLSEPIFRHVLTINGLADHDLFGFAVAFVGDLNGDDCDELAVGAPRYDAPGLTDSGRVWIFFGRPDLESDDEYADVDGTAAEHLSFDGRVDGEWYGTSLATPQDGSGNYLKDLLVGAPGNGPVDDEDAVVGAVYQIETPTLEDASDLAATISGVAIGASPLSGTPGIAGTVELGFVATAHRVLHGDDPGDRFGHALAFVGSVDGLPGQEFLVGAPQFAEESGTRTTSGPGYVRLFNLGNPTPLITIWGEQEPTGTPREGGEAFGFAVAGGLQLNPGTDSVPDFVIGAPLFDATFAGPSLKPDAGRVVAFSGDAAGDGVAIPMFGDPAEENGTVMFGFDSTHEFGFSVAGVPDMDADGIDEVLVGAWEATVVGACTSTAMLRQGGAAYLFFPGSADPGDPPYKFFPEAFRDHMGRAVAAGHLVDTDPPMSPPQAEIVLSGVAWSTSTVSEAGKGYVWLGELLPTSSP